MKKKRSQAKGVGVAQWPTGFGLATWDGNVRHVRIQLRWRKDGDAWVVTREKLDVATGQIEVLKTKRCATEKDAIRTLRHWQEMDMEDARKRANVQQSPPRTRNGEPVTRSDMENVAAARMAVLRRSWPRAFKVMAEQSQGPVDVARIEVAIAADKAEQTGRIEGTTSGADAVEIARAIIRRHERERDGTGLDVDFLLALGWHSDGLCWLTAEELADVVNGTLHTHLNTDAVLQRRKRLGLVARRPPGPR